MAIIVPVFSEIPSLKLLGCFLFAVNVELLSEQDENIAEEKRKKRQNGEVHYKRGESKISLDLDEPQQFKMKRMKRTKSQ